MSLAKDDEVNTFALYRKIDQSRNGIVSAQDLALFLRYDYFILLIRVNKDLIKSCWK